MDTQNTPVHVRLWHRGFWLLAIANLLLCMAVYMLLPVLPSWLATQGFTPKGVAAVMSVYGAGMFLAGPFCGYWVQHYRRNHVCRTAILVMVASLLLFYALGRPSVAALMGGDTLRASILALRIVMGAAFGLSQMVLCSTLIIDSCESFQRTEANYAVAWFGRFALSLGPLAALVCQRFLAPDLLFLLIAGVAFVSVLLIQMVDFPFRAPDENQHMVSLDRFFLPHGWLLFLHLMCITMVAGMLISVSHNMASYAMLMVGFFLAVLSEKFVFADADLKSEVVCGLLLIIAALFMMLRMQSGLTSLSHYVPPSSSSSAAIASAALLRAVSYSPGNWVSASGSSWDLLSSIKVMPLVISTLQPSSLRWSTSFCTIFSCIAGTLPIKTAKSRKGLRFFSTSYCCNLSFICVSLHKHLVTKSIKQISCQILSH